MGRLSSLLILQGKHGITIELSQDSQRNLGLNCHLLLQ